MSSNIEMSSIAVRADSNNLSSQPFYSSQTFEKKIENTAVNESSLVQTVAATQFTSISGSSVEKEEASKKQKTLMDYKQEKFQETVNLEKPSASLFELQKTVTLQKDTQKIAVSMYAEGRVEQVSDKPVYLYTDYLGPCVAVIGRCKVLDSSMLIGVSHLFPSDEDFDPKLDIQISLDKKNDYKNVDKEKCIQDKQYMPNKLIELMIKFFKHPNYNYEEIELFFAGGNGGKFDVFWRELMVEYAKSIPNVKIIGTYFNPYEATNEIQTTIESMIITETIVTKKPKFSLLAGITNTGAIILHKSHDINFQSKLSNLQSLFDKVGIRIPTRPPNISTSSLKI